MKLLIALLLVNSTVPDDIMVGLGEAPVVYKGMCATEVVNQPCIIMKTEDGFVVVYTEENLKGVKPLRAYSYTPEGRKLIWVNPSILI